MVFALLMCHIIFSSQHNRVRFTLNVFKLTLCFLMLFQFTIFTSSSLQIQRPSSQTRCLGTCNTGTCLDGVCVCPAGWTGAQCETCFGRIKLNGTSGSISDGPNNYSPSSRCIWIIENSEIEGILFLKLKDFFTECCWDHVYVYDGDGVYNTLIAVFSGSLPNMEIVAKSGKAIIYFMSDLAFNLPGFTINYEYNRCPYDCNRNGHCNNRGVCECYYSYKGRYCEHQVCMSEMNGKIGPCKFQAHCQDGKCRCHNHTHGDYCQELVLKSVWDTLIINSDGFQPRASHKAVMLDNQFWVFGGLTFTNQQNSNELINFDLKTFEFKTVRSMNSLPIPRYDHSMVIYKNKIYVFGGVVNENTITNEFLYFDLSNFTWNLLNKHTDSLSTVPIAVAGHTAHVIDNEMYVFFGYNSYEAYIHRVQIYSFDTKKWRVGKTDSSIIGKFGHSSVVYREHNKNPMVLIYGGYNAPLNGYSYAISDELFLYDVTEQTWTVLGSTGVPLFRHSAAIVEGVMLIVGGNSHNESSKSKMSNCYLNHFLSFDIVCREWLKTKVFVADSLLANRYGHVALSNNENMFIIGGFNGMMQNDIVKYTPAMCDFQAKSSVECQRSAIASGVQCVFHNNVCIKVKPFTSYPQSFHSFIKAGSPRLQNDCATRDLLGNCLSIKKCGDCVQKGCGWCESTQQCLSNNVGCADGVITNSMNCLFNNKQKIKLQRSQRSCNLATNCFACRQLKHCSWFAIHNINTRHVCVSLLDEALLIEQQNRIQAETALSQSSTSDQRFTAVKSLPNSALQGNLVAPRHLAPSSVVMFPLNGGAVVSSSRVNSTCPAPCFVNSHCQSCVQAQCMWCPSTKRCVPMNTYMINFPYGQCQSWITAANTNHACQLDPYNCELQKTCAECQTVGPRCGWCDDGSGTGLGRCLPGSDSGPVKNGSCSSSYWYFTGEPKCQCNGHSTCVFTNVTVSSRQRCVKCTNKTQGEHCEQCQLGYFGDPRNGGTCRECECNGQATSCNQETGDCHCFTKGVAGSHCDKCEPKYDGDPANGKNCIYQLLIDFIFTFKLDGEDIKDKYVNQINFYSIPSKRDTDVQFSITCEGDSGAKVSINLTTIVFESRPPHSKQLMAGQICTAAGIKRTYSSADPSYVFGSNANTTFHILVSDFITPLKIVISFAQSPPINWVLFFVIFAACFIVLLVVAGLLWMIKLRIEWYRNIRRRHEEIEEMASRPFASVQLQINNSDSVASGLLADTAYLMPTPVSIEPCSNYQAGVYTIVIRLPTGGRSFTPYGTSGLAVGSSLCYLTHAQLALLQPPDSAAEQLRQNGRKSALHRFIPFIRLTS